MFHMQQGRRRGTKPAVCGPFIAVQEEGRERWTLLCIWQETKPFHSVCASICVLIDEMNSGSGKLILAEADLPSLSFIAPRPLLRSLCPVISPQSSLCHSPFGSLSACFSLADRMGGNTNRAGYLALSVFFYWTTCLPAQVRLLHHSPFNSELFTRSCLL